MSDFPASIIFLPIALFLLIIPFFDPETITYAILILNVIAGIHIIFFYDR